MSRNSSSDHLKIVSFASQNPARQAELADGINKVLQDRPCEIVFAENEQAAIEAIPGAEVLLAHWITPPILAAADSLRWFHNSNAGIESNLFPEFRDSPVILTNSSGIHGEFIAEWVLTALLYLAQGCAEIEQWRHDRKWKPHKDAITRNRFLLSGNKALILGYGATGRAIADKLVALGVSCEALALNKRKAGIPIHHESELANIIGDYDIVVVTLPLTPRTRLMLNADNLARMKQGSILVNIARGAIVDETSLIELLQTGHLAGAALDVFTEEPLPEHSPLFNFPNVFLSPHVSGNFPEYTVRVHEQFLDNLSRYVRGEPLRNIVDKQRGY